MIDLIILQIRPGRVISILDVRSFEDPPCISDNTTNRAKSAIGTF